LSSVCTDTNVICICATYATGSFFALSIFIFVNFHSGSELMTTSSPNSTSNITTSPSDKIASTSSPSHTIENSASEKRPTLITAFTTGIAVMPTLPDHRKCLNLLIIKIYVKCYAYTTFSLCE